MLPRTSIALRALTRSGCDAARARSASMCVEAELRGGGGTTDGTGPCWLPAEACL